MSLTLAWKTILLAGGAVCLSAMGAMAGQPASLYRGGTPAVLTPEVKKAAVPVEVPSVPVRDAFRRFYKQAGSPRLAVFWNRALDDRLREMEAESRVVFARTTARRTDDGASRALADPSRPVRDRQLIEVLALKDHADLLIQIMPTPSDEPDSGAVFHVSVIEIKSGRILGSFVRDATPAKETKTSRKWKAVRGGFVEVEETETPKVDLERLGRMLASQTMVVLSRT